MHHQNTVAPDTSFSQNVRF
jgi:hypothetical protein